MFKSEAHNVFTEKVSKIAIIFNDDKRQSFNSAKYIDTEIRLEKYARKNYENILEQRN